MRSAAFDGPASLILALTRDTHLWIHEGRRPHWTPRRAQRTPGARPDDRASAARPRRRGAGRSGRVGQVDLGRSPVPGHRDRRRRTRCGRGGQRARRSGRHSEAFDLLDQIVTARPGAASTTCDRHLVAWTRDAAGDYLRVARSVGLSACWSSSTPRALCARRNRDRDRWCPPGDHRAAATGLRRLVAEAADEAGTSSWSSRPGTETKHAEVGPRAQLRRTTEPRDEPGASR